MSGERTTTASSGSEADREHGRAVQRAAQLAQTVEPM